MSQLVDTLRGLWRARSPRERRFLLGLAGFMIAALLGQIWWTAHDERMRLRQQVPQWRLQLAEAQRQSGEIRQMQTQSAPTANPEGAALLAAVAATAHGTAMASSMASLQLDGPRQVRLRTVLPFDAWLMWVGALQRDVRLRLIQCHITAGSSAGQVEVDALFALPDPD